MSEVNVEIVRRAYAAYARGDLAEAGSAYSEDTVWDVSRFRPDIRVHRGIDELGDSISTWREAWEDHFFELEQAIPAGERVVAVIREGGRGKGSGAEVEIRYGQVITVRDGMIVETVVYRDPRDAYKAAGLDS
jgi:ketosteroid isomerase-like protein